MLDQSQLHEQILYPVVRVKTSEAGGSGVLVYSEEDPKKPGSYINIAFTCEHVIDSAIQTREEWDPVLKRQRKADFFQEVSIEVFDYDDSTIVSANSTQADIIAYDKHHDLAAVRLHNNRKMDHVSQVLPKGEIEKLRLFDPVWVSGCSLLHDPFANPGTLTYLREMIEQKKYLMTNAPSIFGNSGGGLFHGNSGNLLGLTSRITSIQLGFGIDVMTWMGFSTHPERMYEFMEYQELQFVTDSSDDYYSAMARRKNRQKQALREMVMGKEATGKEEQAAE
tara:strand:+ start:1924 stop:2763 length:840 start_codon:yes stop_codon:yes gene_type:complete